MQFSGGSVCDNWSRIGSVTPPKESPPHCAPAVSRLSRFSLTAPAWGLSCTGVATLLKQYAMDFVGGRVTLLFVLGCLTLVPRTVVADRCRESGLAA